MAIIRLDHVNVALNGTRVLHDVNWELRRGDNWALFGHNGAGKSTLLRLLRGEVWPEPVSGGTRTYTFDGKPTQSPIGVKRRMACVTAEQQTRYMRQHEWQLTVRDIVFSGFFDSEVLWQRPTRAQAKAVDATLALLGITDIADAGYRRLSQGQFRKALIGRALVAQPDVLVLDEVGVGLDAAARHHLLDLIQRVAEGGTQILMTTHRRDELIPAITHVLELKGGRIVRVEERRDAARAAHAPSARFVERDQPPRVFETLGVSDALIDIRNASVALNEGATVVLRDVTWRLNAGEHWMIVGDNGVGKSTLLKLILGEARPADGGAIHRFGQNGNTSVWEIKKRIGFVSADFQARYAAELTAEQVIASGFFASVGWLQPTTRAQDRRVREVIELFGLRPLAKRSLQDMSYGQARKVLIARALVNRPRVLILDEVFDGLDAQFRAELAGILQQASAATSLILVSHHEADTLPCITHRMTLAGGRVARLEARVP